MISLLWFPNWFHIFPPLFIPMKVSKGCLKAIEILEIQFPDLVLVAISGNMCTDKKPSAINWWVTIKHAVVDCHHASSWYLRGALYWIKIFLPISHPRYPMISMSGFSAVARVSSLRQWYLTRLWKACWRAVCTTWLRRTSKKIILDPPWLVREQ